MGTPLICDGSASASPLKNQLSQFESASRFAFRVTLFLAMATKLKPAPTPALPYLRPAGLTFLRNLAKHNDREWFTPRKAQFEAELKEPMLAIVRKVTDAMADFAPNHVRPAEKSLFRIYRDTRFSSATSGPIKPTSRRGGRTRGWRRLRVRATTFT